MTYYWNVEGQYIYVGHMLPGDRPATQEEIDAHYKPTLQDYDDAIEAHIKKVANENDFNSIDSCGRYIGCDSPFEEHATALRKWNSDCWVKCHEILDSVDMNNPPSIEEVIAMLPKFHWNKPVYSKIK